MQQGHQRQSLGQRLPTNLRTPHVMDFDLSWLLLALPAAFALGWLAAQRERALAACKSDLKRFVDAKRFWRERPKKSADK